MTTETPTPDATNTTDSATSQTADTTATAADTASQTAATTATTTDTTTTTEQAAPAGAPETYEFAAPEGQTFDAAIISAYSEVAKELDLPQDKAQKLLDTMSPAIVARQAEQFEQTKAKWDEDARADKEVGGDKFAESLALAAKTRDTFATPELRTLLDETGLGNHPDVLKFFVKVGKAISEDGFTPGRSGGGSTTQSVAQRMYPNMNP
jgi:hypothetical protein